jgi:hypothetical protein
MDIKNSSWTATRCDFSLSRSAENDETFKELVLTHMTFINRIRVCVDRQIAIIDETLHCLKLIFCVEFGQILIPITTNRIAIILFLCHNIGIESMQEFRYHSCKSPCDSQPTELKLH